MMLVLVGGYASGLLSAYIINTVWTFRERAVPFSLGSAFRFVLVTVVILGLCLGCLELISDCQLQVPCSQRFSSHSQQAPHNS